MTESIKATMAEIVVPTQADRTAAENCANEACRNMDGELDFEAMARHFARHALQARREAVEEAARVAEDKYDDASDADNEYDGGAGASGYRMACSAIAKAIRALQGEAT